MYVIYCASLLSHVLYNDDLNRQWPWYGSHQLQLDGQIVAYFSVKNHQNGIWQTNFDTAFLSRLHSHIRITQLLVSSWCILAFGNNITKYFWNECLVHPFLNWDKNKTKLLIHTIFFFFLLNLKLKSSITSKHNKTI